jgi:hypothetical protein
MNGTGPYGNIDMNRSDSDIGFTWTTNNDDAKYNNNDEIIGDKNRYW